MKKKLSEQIKFSENISNDLSVEIINGIEKELSDLKKLCGEHQQQLLEIDVNHLQEFYEILVRFVLDCNKPKTYIILTVIRYKLRNFLRNNLNIKNLPLPSKNPKPSSTMNDIHKRPVFPPSKSSKPNSCWVTASY